MPPAVSLLPSGPQQQAGYRRREEQQRGDQQADAHAVQEGLRVGDEGAEDRDGQRAAELTAGVEHAAGGPGALGWDAAQQQRGDGGYGQGATETDGDRQ